MSYGRQLYKSEVRQRIFIKYGGQCHLCDKPVNLRDFTIDHIKPISWFKRKHRHQAHNETNLAPAHEECNMFRGNLSVEDARRKIALKHKPLGITPKILITI